MKNIYFVGMMFFCFQGLFSIVEEPVGELQITLSKKTGIKGDVIASNRYITDALNGLRADLVDIHTLYAPNSLNPFAGLAQSSRYYTVCQGAIRAYDINGKIVYLADFQITPKSEAVISKIILGLDQTAMQLRERGISTGYQFVSPSTPN
jgi:hypothetical protein